MSTVARFQVLHTPWPGGGVELTVGLKWLSKRDDDIPRLSPGCVSEGEWRGVINELIDDLRAVEKRGLKMLRAAKAAGPQPITED